MRAEIISVGTELLLGQIVDTNAAYLSSILPSLGVTLKFRQTVGDNESRISEALELALSRADVVIAIGGLGPTEDDLTKETVAKVLDEELVMDEPSAERIREFFARRNIQMPETNLKQALKPANGIVLPNEVGTAPGAVFEKGEKAVIVLPGPPNEFIPMVDKSVVPYLIKRGGETAGVIKSKILRICGLGESAVEQKVKDLLHSENPTVAPLAHLGEVHLRITAKANNSQEADRLIGSIEEKLRERLGDSIYGVDGSTLEQVIVQSLAERGLKLALAESCTGGLVANRITNVSGSSAVFLAGLVTYSNEAKIQFLGVPEEMLKAYGAVSHQVAQAMAEGARDRVGADIALGITGIAGPTGGTPTKPVGLVYISLSSKAEPTQVEEYRFGGTREDIKHRASQTALTLLRTYLLRLPHDKESSE